MYLRTGLPGWIRYGFSPGWLDRSPSGLPPAAQWIKETGQLSEFVKYLKTSKPTPFIPSGAGFNVSKVQSKEALERQRDLLKKQLEAIEKRLRELE